MINEKDKTYKQKFLAFVIRMVKLKNYLNEQKHEYNIADQIQRSCTALELTTVRQLSQRVTQTLSTNCK